MPRETIIQSGLHCVMVYFQRSNCIFKISSTCSQSSIIIVIFLWKTKKNNPKRKTHLSLLKTIPDCLSHQGIFAKRFKRRERTSLDLSMELYFLFEFDERIQFWGTMAIPSSDKSLEFKRRLCCMNQNHRLHLFYLRVHRLLFQKWFFKGPFLYEKALHIGYSIFISNHFLFRLYVMVVISCEFSLPLDDRMEKVSVKPSFCWKNYLIVEQISEWWQILAGTFFSICITS